MTSKSLGIKDDLQLIEGASDSNKLQDVISSRQNHDNPPKDQCQHRHRRPAGAYGVAANLWAIRPDLHARVSGMQS
jgi:hypothetical protein